jgi:hypothetical protein
MVLKNMKQSKNRPKCDGKLGGDSSVADFEEVWSSESIRSRAAEKLSTFSLFFLVRYVLCICICS